MLREASLTLRCASEATSKTLEAWAAAVEAVVRDLNRGAISCVGGSVSLPIGNVWPEAEELSLLFTPWQQKEALGPWFVGALQGLPSAM